MKEFIDRIKAIGYKDIIEESVDHVVARGGKSLVSIIKTKEKELTPKLINTLISKLLLLDTVPDYAWITNGEANSYQDVMLSKAIPEIPAPLSKEEEKLFGRREITKRDRWSYQMYEQLQTRFDQLHQLIYDSRDSVDNTNDAIDEFCKLIFMEEFRINHPDYKLKKGELAGKKINDLLWYERFDKDDVDKKAIVEEIRSAFKEIKDHPDYVAHLDDASLAPIFDPDAYLKLGKPEIYYKVLKALQDLGEITLNGTNRKATLNDLSGDVLGRVFDVLIRGKFENKGGMGIYLTPRQVTEAAVDILMHDLKKTPGKIIKLDRNNIPEFKVLDGCCGSGGFLIKMLEELKQYLLIELAGDRNQWKDRFEKMKEHSIVGADNSPGMILKARINMALHGANKAQIFKTENSLTSPQLKPETFDVILTNPPFKSGGISEKSAEGKTTLRYFSDDIEEGVNKMSSKGLSLGCKPDGKGKWNPVNSMDPAVLFIDRYLQLLKPGGVCMMVVPDGILSNTGERYVREYLMGKKNDVTGEFEGGKAILKAVISLPQETFSLSGAGAKTSLLYFKKKEHSGENQGSVFMAVADKVGFTVKNKVEIQLGDDHNDLLKILDAYKRAI